MAGHSKFKNIQHRKGAQDQKRAKIFTKLVREIVAAVKIGGEDPTSNPRLRSAIIAARSHNLPKERIDRAISLEQADTTDYVEVRYEGYAPGGIAVIVEALTDNKNRTASDIRSTFTKYGGNLGETGSVSFMFDHLGSISYPISCDSADDMLSYVLECSAQDLSSDDEYHLIYTTIGSFAEVLSKLTDRYGNPIKASIIWKPKEIIRIDDQEKAEKLGRMIEMLEDFDDVQNLFTNYELSPRLKDSDI